VYQRVALDGISSTSISANASLLKQQIRSPDTISVAATYLFYKVKDVSDFASRMLAGGRGTKGPWRKVFSICTIRPLVLLCKGKCLPVSNNRTV
jgi:hypothetical protein